MEFKKIFCWHDYVPMDWCWTRPWDSTPAFIYYRSKCSKCGRTRWNMTSPDTQIGQYLLKHKELMNV